MRTINRRKLVFQFFDLRGDIGIRNHYFCNGLEFFGVKEEECGKVRGQYQETK